MTTLNPDLLADGGLSYSQKPLPPNQTLHVVTFINDKTLNALTSATFHALHAILDLVKPPCTLLLHSTGRAFSAGGDVRFLRRKVLEAGPADSAAREEAARIILATEYDFLRRFHALGHGNEGVVTVGVCDGYAFGAGLGLLQACRVRLVTHRAVFSMPEVRIGLIPDCGATWFYTKMDGCVGMYAALTACRIIGGDALALGLADGIVDKGWAGEGISPGVKGVPDCTDMNLAKTELSDNNGKARRWIDDCFSGGSLAEIEERVSKKGGEWTTSVLTEMNKGSPTAMRECFEALRQGYRGGGLEEALNRELRMEAKLAARWDFEEGVRAVIIDKDNTPKWK